MDDWTSGYVADIGYTFGFQPELNPLRAKLPLLGARLQPPASAAACELGFGQGLSINLHAAGSTVHWHGTDFMPSHAAFADKLAATFDNGPQVCDQSFEEFCARADLPDFDFIGLHGVWSWVSDENRHIIVDFIRRKLRVGGVLYVSYNTEAGWGAMIPLRNLMAHYGETMTAPGAGSLAKVDNTLGFVQKLWAANPSFAANNPKLTDRLNKLGQANRSYLAHEYFNRNWKPMSFADVAAWLAPAKMTFACSATYLENVPGTQMTAEQHAMLNELPDPVLRQNVRDFMVNQQFRRDYWVKGARQLNAQEYAEQLRALRLLMVAPPAGIQLSVSGPSGTSQLAEALYTPIIKLMADHQIRSIGDMEQALQAHGIGLPQLHQAIMVLVEKSALALVQDDAVIAASRPQTAQLNRALLAHMRNNGDIQCLASPVLGGGIAIERLQQLFAISLADGSNTPEEWARYAGQVLKAQGQQIFKAGKPLQNEADILAELGLLAQSFQYEILPILRAAGIF